MKKYLHSAFLSFIFVLTLMGIGTGQAFAQFTVTAAAGPNGTISPSGTKSYTIFSNSFQYNYTADAGYYVADVVIDGVSEGPIASPYVFINLTSNHTISVSFAPFLRITATPGPHGTVFPAGVSLFSPGNTSPYYSWNPDAGYHIADVVIDGVSQGAIYPPWVFNDITSNHTISVSFAADFNNITVSAGLHGIVSNLGSNQYAAGSDVSIALIPDPGYRVATITVDGVTTATSTQLFTFPSISTDHTFSATFEPDFYTITVSSGPHGYVTGLGANQYAAGTDVSIAPIPDPGYHTATFTVDGTTYQGSTFQFTFPALNADHTFSATFAPDFYTITVTSGPHGSVSGLGANQYPSGSDVAIVPFPDPGYQLATYTFDGNVVVGSTAQFVFPALDADHTFGATFEPIIYTITATAGSHGSISNAGTVNVNGGSDQTYTITPALGYKVSQVTVDGISQGSITQYTFHVLVANHTISVNFVPDVSFTIKATAGANGSITPSGNTSVGYGNNATYTITPATGYHVATLKVDGTSLNPATSYTFNNVTANHTINATFALTSYTITASAGAGGTISPTGTATVSPGGTKTYTIKPTAGYTVSDVTLDGVSIGTVRSYVFTNVSANHLIIATFTPVTYVITSSAGANGSISPSGPVSLAYGGSQTYTFTPAAGYSITKLTVDGKSVAIAPSYTFTNVTAAHTITVTFICPKPTTPVISGPATVIKQQDNLVYTVTNAAAGNSFTWTVPGAASITSGQGTSSITVKWGKTAGNVTCIASNTCSSSAKTTYAVALGSGTRSADTEPIVQTPAVQETPSVTLQVNPNPAQEKAKIIFNLAEAAKCKISLIDVTGRLLTTIETDGVKGYNEATIDVSRFAGGTYYVSLIHGKEIKTVMLVKAH